MLTPDGRLLNLLVVHEDSPYCQILSEKASKAVIVAAGERVSNLRKSIIFEYDKFGDPLPLESDISLDECESKILSEAAFYNTKVSEAVICENKRGAITSNINNVCRSYIVQAGNNTDHLEFEDIDVKYCRITQKGKIEERTQKVRVLLLKDEFIEVDGEEIPSSLFAIDPTTKSMLSISGAGYRRISPEEIRNTNDIYYANAFYRKFALFAGRAPI